LTHGRGARCHADRACPELGVQRKLHAAQLEHTGCGGMRPARRRAPVRTLEWCAWGGGFR
jgi:hypothetical protein